MAEQPIWTFTQLGGPRKTLGLSGWQAPFGRPRASTLVNAGLKIRTQITYYPGANTEPTVHAFGPAPKEWELKGRFMDYALAGTGQSALGLRRAWFDFVNDQQVVRATWGNFLSYRMFIEEIDLNIEASTDVAWAMKALVFADEAAPIFVPAIPPQSPADMAAEIRDAMKDVEAFDPYAYISDSIRSLLDLFPQISDFISATIVAITTPLNELTDICSALTDFTSALPSQLGAVAASLSSLVDAVGKMRDITTLLDSHASQFDIDLTTVTPVGVFSAPDSIERSIAKIAADRATANLLALIADMRNEVDRALLGRADTAHVAQAGDTWDSIARRTLGGVDGARAIRSLNGARYGSQPQPGTIVKIPRTA